MYSVRWSRHGKYASRLGCPRSTARPVAHAIARNCCQPQPGISGQYTAKLPEKGTTAHLLTVGGWDADAWETSVSDLFRVTKDEWVIPRHGLDVHLHFGRSQVQGALDVIHRCIDWKQNTRGTEMSLRDARHATGLSVVRAAKQRQMVSEPEDRAASIGRRREPRQWKATRRC
jgi:hypothetical protein